MRKHCAIVLLVFMAFASRAIHAADTIRNIDGIMAVGLMDATAPGVPFDITG